MATSQSLWRLGSHATMYVSVGPSVLGDSTLLWEQRPRLHIDCGKDKTSQIPKAYFQSTPVLSTVSPSQLPISYFPSMCYHVINYQSPLAHRFPSSSSSSIHCQCEPYVFLFVKTSCRKIRSSKLQGLDNNITGLQEHFCCAPAISPLAFLSCLDSLVIAFFPSTIQAGKTLLSHQSIP